MAYTTDDIRRSLQRYLAMTLPEEWTVRAERRYVADDARPVAVVDVGVISTVSARTSPIQGEVVELLPVTVTAYPELPVEVDPDTEETPEPTADQYREARKRADDLVTHLSRWLSVGITVEDEDGNRFSGPERLPLWDYAETPLVGPDRGGPEDPHDVMWLEEGSASTRGIQDPDDPIRWSIVCEFQVSIERPGRGPLEDDVMDIEAIQGTWKPEPSDN